MNTDKFLERINVHTKNIYENEIEEVLENGRIINWLIGLAGGSLLFSFNNLNDILNEYIVGQEMDGTVERVECEAYQFVNEQTGEIIELNHRWVFVSKDEKAPEFISAEHQEEPELV